MRSAKSYLISALHQWITDSGMTPYLLVDASFSGVQVPESYVHNNEIVLNIASKACRDLKITQNATEFLVSFSGVVYEIFLPTGSIMAIYAQENGKGMSFIDASLEDDEEGGTADDIVADKDNVKTPFSLINKYKIANTPLGKKRQKTPITNEAIRALNEKKHKKPRLKIIK